METFVISKFKVADGLEPPIDMVLTDNWGIVREMHPCNTRFESPFLIYYELNRNEEFEHFVYDR